MAPVWLSYYSIFFHGFTSPLAKLLTLVVIASFVPVLADITQELRNRSLVGAMSKLVKHLFVLGLIGLLSSWVCS